MVRSYGTTRLIGSSFRKRSVAGQAISRLTPGAIQYPLPGSKNAATGFGRRGPDEMRRGFGMYHLVRASDGLVVGEMGFHQPPADATVELGFGVAETCRGAGYASEALAELVRWAFSQPGLDQVVARTMDTNLAAQNVLKRVGFRYVSPDGDFNRYVITAADIAPVSDPFEVNESGRDVARLPVQG